MSFMALVLLFGVAVVALAQRSTKAEELDPSVYPEDSNGAS
jgi:hypothetical protein